ncbi:serine hydrolase [Nonomuraea sp. NPDC005983]|uniref:serine hydrolase n=1 Tax=Nonomuraea sp. NPDC005983 TaxID=3155595 RepID=UPI0033BBE488
MKSASRPLRVLAVAATAVAVTLTSGAAQAAARPLAPSPSPSSPAVEIPDTPVGAQVRWLLDASTRAPIAEGELREHLTAAFLQQVPPAQVNQVLASVANLRLQKIVDARPTVLVGEVTAGGKTYKLTISVDAAGKIASLQFSVPAAPQPAPTSWQELDQRLRKVAPDVGFLAAEVTEGGRCRTVHAVSPGEPRPLGSMFKLYVLGTVAKQVKQGTLDWDTELTIKPELKSLPSGRLQDRPDNSKVTVLEAAKLMISISDNTGADLLLHEAGRRSVEKTVRAWSAHAKRNVPFLSTRELFALKGADYPRLAERYLSLGTAQRRDYLAKVVDKVPLPGIVPWAKPRELNTVEWFASPEDVCRVYAKLAGLRSKEIGQIMSANGGGLGLPPGTWPTVWYKGGSEPGLLDLSYLARTSSGRTFVVTALASNPDAPFAEDQVTEELLALSRGAFTLLGRS